MAILIYISSMATAFLVWYQMGIDDADPRKKIKINHSAILMLAMAMVAAVATIISSIQDAEQKDQIDRNVLATKNLAETNKKVTENIEYLQKLNNEIALQTRKLAIKTDTITDQSLALSAKNIELTEKLNPIVSKIDRSSEKIDKVVSNIYGQQTGGLSIPLIEAKMEFYDKLNPSRNRASIDEKFFDKAVVLFTIKNYGIYPVTNVQIQTWNASTQKFEDVNFFNSIKGNFIQQAAPSMIVGDCTIDSFQITDHISRFFEVRWKTLYTFAVSIDEKTNSLVTTYTYVSKNYGVNKFEKAEDFVKFIRKDFAKSEEILLKSKDKL